MPEKSTFDYIDNDPLMPVTLINPASNKKAKAIAYLDTGSDTVVIPRELWLKLGLEMLCRSNVCAVGGIVTAWYTRINVEFLENEHREIIAFYQEEGDVLIGRNVMDEYSITFDGRNSNLTIKP
jgi:predicted aspartyl protease